MTDPEEAERWPGDPFLSHGSQDQESLVQQRGVNRDPLGEGYDPLLLHASRPGSEAQGSLHHPPSRPMSSAEAYHRFLWHNKHVLFELKLSVIVILGGLIVLACVVYIVMQCRARVRPAGGGGGSHGSKSVSKSSSSNSISNVNSCSDTQSLEGPHHHHHHQQQQQQQQQRHHQQQQKQQQQLHFYHPRNRREDEKELFGSSETLENLLPTDKNSIRLKVRKDQEFFV